MSTKAKVSKDFSSNRYTDAELSVKAGQIESSMTGNPAFPEPIPTLGELNTANAAYKESLDKAVDGSKSDTVRKNNLRASLVLLLQQLADYVQTASNGNEEIILSSGFDVNKKPSTVGPLTKPENFKVVMGSNKGSVIASCDVVENASFYEFEYTEKGATTGYNWIKLTSTRHKLLIEGLLSGKEYSFRVAGAGSDPSRVWSNEITTFVV